MKTIYFVRHGETDANAGGLLQGGAVTEINAVGKKQAEIVAERCSKLSAEIIISSTYLRAKQTAEIIAIRTGLRVEYTDLLVEWGRGSDRLGKSTKDSWLKEKERMLLENLRDNARIGDEEIFEQLNIRAKKALEYLAARPESTIIVTSHGLFNRILLGRIVMGDDYTGLDCQRFLRSFRTTNTGLTVAMFSTPDAWTPWEILTWNDHAHLG